MDSASICTDNQEVSGEPKLIYVTSQWGAPTQTFVRREASAIADTGVAVSALSLKPPGTAAEGDYTWLSARQVARGLAKAIWKRPLQSLGLVASVRHAALPNVPPILAATLVGLAWSGSGLVTAPLLSHFGWVSGAAARAAALHAGQSYSIVYHAFDIHTDGVLDDFASRMAASAHQTFVIAQADIAHVTERLGVEPELLRMGVPSSWLTDVARPRDNGREIISVGSLVEKKGHGDLLKALAFDNSPWHLTIVGEGPLRPHLEALIHDLGLSGRVSLAGLKTEEQVHAALATADVFALACVTAADGNRDGIPVALMEAMALGLPVVTTDVGAVRELVEGVGYVVASGRPAELATALAALEDDDHRHQLGLRGKNRIADGWTVEEHAGRLALAVAASADS